MLRKLTLTVFLLIALGGATGQTANAKLSQATLKYWIGVGRCEQRGNGIFGVQWNFPGPKYQGGLGFYSGTWDWWASELNPGGRSVLSRFPNAGDAPWRVQIWVADYGLKTHNGYWGCI